MIGWGVELMMVMDEGWKGDDWLSVGWPDIVWWWYGGDGGYDDVEWIIVMLGMNNMKWI